ncbi:MAG TPA: hypothetical protein VGB38_04795 [bacterium]
MVATEQKFFACPECGSKYRVQFNGGRFRCRQCRFLFQVPDSRIETRKTNPGPSNGRIAWLTAVLVILLFMNGIEAFLMVRFYRRVQPLVKTAGEAVKYIKEISGKFD